MFVKRHLLAASIWALRFCSFAGLVKIFYNFNLRLRNYPPASKLSREVANLTERKNLHTPIYGNKEFACPSFCLSVTTLTPIISGQAEQNGLKQI